MSNSHPTASRATSSPLRILVVENHPDTMMSLATYLEALGHVVYCARSQTEGIVTLSHNVVDVLISDIGLPDGDGWELMERADLSANVYCVAMSGFGAAADRARSRAAGYRRHLLKPFNPSEIDAILEEAASERLAVG